MAKLIYAKSRVGFDLAYADKTSIDKSIAFLEDGWIWTHGQYFKIFPDRTPLFVVSANGPAVSIQDGNNKELFALNLGVLTVSGDGVVESSTTTGAVTLSHKTIGEASVSVGPTTNSGTTIIVPQITFDKYGHYLSVTNRTATLTNVKSNNVDASSTPHYLIGSSNSATETSELQKTSNISFIPSTGTFNATSFVENGTTLASKYAPLSHTSVLATGSVSGHVTLSDSISSTSGASSGIAATPKAVNDVYLYAQNIIASGDAMIFKGTIGSVGVITGGTDVNGKTLSTLTDYKAGWTFKVAVTQTITGIGTLEAGDIVMSVKDRVSAYNNADFTVIQVNIDGSVIASAALTADQLVVGAGNNGVKTLTAGTSGQYLMANATGIPTWTTVNKTYRGVSVNGTSALTESTLDTLAFKNGTGVSLSWNSTNKELTVGTNLQNLSIQNSGTALGSYIPSGATNNTINFGSGLTASLSANVFTVNHSNSTTAQATSAVRSFTYDANGHITGSSVITSLPNANDLILKINGGTTEGTSQYTYDGSAVKTLNIKSGTNVTFTNTVAGELTINSTNTTYTFYDLIFKNSSNATVDTYKPTTSPTKTFKAGNNIEFTAASNVITITGTNTWRNVSAYNTTNVLGEVLSTTIGTDDLQFGSEFLWDTTNKEVKIGWAEISAAGAITYAY